MKLTALLFCLLFLFAGSAQALSVKELTTVEGIQENEITGIGLVIGLEGTGDKKNPEKNEMVKNFIHNSDFGTLAENMDAKNTAFVIVTGRIPPFTGKGQSLELTVSAVGDAKSLEKGTLLYTQLYYPGEKGSEKVIYATAEGPVKSPEGYPKTSGVVHGILQKEIPSTLMKDGRVHLMLRKPDFTDAVRITRQINQSFKRHAKRNIAKATSAGLIKVEVPETFNDNPIAFIAEMEKVPVLFTDIPAKVRINTKSGMVSFNEKVEISPFAFSYKDLTLVVEGQAKGPVTPDSKRVLEFPAKDPAKPNLKNLVDSLNAMRVGSDDLVEIIQEIYKLGALNAELIIE